MKKHWIGFLILLLSATFAFATGSSDGDAGDGIQIRMACFIP